ncbi:hypothetical protein ACFTWD_06505 [Streptomyces sp. NPDC056943]|uniref:hypothetical protein n=1 Tax=Streptomyces sp. NPDC056943 TaxID=3345971 RepID=UPI00362510DC
MGARIDHEAIFAKGVIYYIFSFDAGGPLDIRRSADRLLRAGIAETVVSPSSGEVRVAHRYRALARLLNQTSTLQELDRAIQEGGILKWSVRHPIWSLKLLAGVFRSRGAGRSEQDDTSMADLLSENLIFLHEAVAREQSINAVQHAIENNLLNPTYLLSEPYLRLRLIGAKQWLNRMNGGLLRDPGNLEEGVMVDALLLLHRSGVMQLTIAVRLPDNISVENYRQMASSSSEIVSASSLPEPIIKAASDSRRWEARLAGQWEDEMEAGVRWRMIEHPSPMRISDLFNIYADAISGTLGSSGLQAWLCYPAAFIDHVDCCATEEEFKQLHADELKNAIARSIDVARVRPEFLPKILSEEGSVTVEKSLYCDPSSSLEINWDGSSEILFERHLWTLVLLESALLQYWQIRLLDHRISVTSGKLKSVRELQLEAIFGLREYRDSGIVYGTALDLAERLLQGWRADRLHSHVLASLDQLQQLAVATESIKGGRRANLLAATALIVALFFGLPAVNDTLEIAAKVKVEGLLAIPLGPFRDLATLEERGAWIGYLLFLASVGIPAMTLALSRWSRGLRRRRRRHPGMSWPVPLTVEQGEGSSGDVEGSSS